MTSQEQENKELIREFIQAFNREDKAFIKDVFSDELWEELGWEGRYQAHEVFPDHHETIEHAIAEDDMVAVRYRFSGTHEGKEYLGVPPTGNEVSWDVHTHARIEDGKITEWWEEWDTESLFRGLGIHPDSITESRIRNQLLEVMLRVLRHNIRNDLNAITGLAEMVARGDVPPEEFGERIQAKASDLQATAEKVREVERAIVHKRSNDTIHLTEFIGSIVADLRGRHPEAKIDISISDQDLNLSSNRDVLSLILEEAIENAILHAETSEPEIEVNLSRDTDDQYSAILTVADNGPGIPDHELEPVERGSENPLEHGSGIGLWTIKWGVELIGGDIEFGENEPTGSVVKMYLGGMN